MEYELIPNTTLILFIVRVAAAVWKWPSRNGHSSRGISKDTFGNCCEMGIGGIERRSPFFGRRIYKPVRFNFAVHGEDLNDSGLEKVETRRSNAINRVK